MAFPKTILSQYTYELPESKIAFNPAELRGGSKLLHYENGEIHDLWFNEISNCLKTSDNLYFNNAKVIPARLFFTKPTGAKIEVFLLEPKNKDYSSLYNKNQVVWNCLVGNKKRWKDGEVNLALEGENLRANWDNREGNTIVFSWDSNKPFTEVLENAGKMPLPPYIKREAESIDSNHYQTVYAKTEGAVAAPTAGLHFTDAILDDLVEKGVRKQELTLFVGAGTFKPVTVEDASQHDMHTEKFSVSRALLESLIQNTGRVVCVGTTSVRVLESLYWMGVKLKHGTPKPFHIGRSEAYELPQIELKEAIHCLLDDLDKKSLKVLEAETGIFIVPGYEFKLVDVLITNFHQPGSTLIMLVAAFIGEDWQKVYDHALNNKYRFLSYGDSSILFKKNSFKVI